MAFRKTTLFKQAGSSEQHHSGPRAEPNLGLTFGTPLSIYSCTELEGCTNKVAFYAYSPFKQKLPLADTLQLSSLLQQAQTTGQ
jgi:hypothetical protein